MLTWKDAVVSLGIATALGVSAAVGYTYYFHHALGQMTGSSINTLAQIVAKPFS